MQMMTIDSDSRETMIRHFTRVSPIYVWGSLLWLGSILWSSCLGERSSINYKYLDNNLYTIPALPRTNSVDTLSERAEEFERRFPPPPLFPPPPPSIKGDTNALLRQAIYNNLHDKLKRARKRRKGDGKEEGADSSGSITDFPCDKFLQQESSGAYTNKPDEPNKPVGPKVIKGPPGSSGLPGLPGPKGDRGRRGRKGHEGPIGPPGPAGIVGPPGPPGTAGRPGQHGRDGAKGDRGEAGADGFRGRSGPSGPRGPVGMPGTRGKDGIPGLVIFPDDVAMKGVELEGLLAYRQDSKQLYFRDHETWRVIRTSQCGDGIVDPDTGEECDDGDRKSRDCVSCQRRRGPRCGNGVREYNEECDGRDFAGKTCNSWRPSMKGTLYCTSSCVISYHRCRFDLR